MFVLPVFRRYEDELENTWGCGSWLEYIFTVILATILLIGATALTLVWVICYRGGFAWQENPQIQFNLHPVLMVAGFITLSGFCKFSIHAHTYPHTHTRQTWKLDLEHRTVVIIVVFVFFSFFAFPFRHFAAILLYRLCRCLKHIYAKLAHTLFHALAIPCIGLGFLAVYDSHNLANPPIPNFYSLHSWLGLVTMGLFVLQFVFGFFT